MGGSCAGDAWALLSFSLLTSLHMWLCMFQAMLIVFGSCISKIWAPLYTYELGHVPFCLVSRACLCMCFVLGLTGSASSEVLWWYS